MQLSKGIPVRFGTLKGTVFGGRFLNYEAGTRRLVGIKMAQEIDHPHDFKVDTPDFSVPSVADMQQGILYGLQALADGKDIYVGCMGGIGRTGLYMGCMAKLMKDFHNSKDDEAGPMAMDPVKYVRTWYMSHAIETAAQQAYVQTFDTAPALAWLYEREEAYAPKTAPAPVIREVEVVKIVYQSPIDWVAYQLNALFSDRKSVV